MPNEIGYFASPDDDREEAEAEEGEWSFDVYENEVPAIAARPRTSPAHPSEPENGTWLEFFQAVKARGKKGREDAARIEPVLVSSVELPDDAPLSLSPRKYFGRAKEMGWEMRLRQSTVHYFDVFQMNDGKVKKGGGQVFKGELVTPAHDKLWTFVSAAGAKYHAGFNAHWIDGKFAAADCVDPLGFKWELEADYWKNGRDSARKEIKIGEVNNRRRREALYNDGAGFDHPRVTLFTATEFESWLYGWMELIIPGFERPALKEKAPVEQPLFEGQLAKGEFWHG